MVKIGPLNYKYINHIYQYINKCINIQFDIKINWYLKCQFFCINYKFQSNMNITAKFI